MTPRTLSKSDFKLARTCDAKLFFRENGYPDNRDSNPYLALLAEGGYMVEALAKAKYVDGVQLEYGGGVAEDYQRTIDQLGRDQVTLFEATLLVGRQQARVDILEKKGNTVRLLEVKAKSFDGAEHALSLSNGKAGALRGKNKPYKILNDWEEKLEDITFQVLLLEKTLPGVVIKPTPVSSSIRSRRHRAMLRLPAELPIAPHRHFWEMEPDGCSPLATSGRLNSSRSSISLPRWTSPRKSQCFETMSRRPRRSLNHGSMHPFPFIPRASSGTDRSPGVLPVVPGRGIKHAPVTFPAVYFPASRRRQAQGSKELITTCPAH